jgi:ABC-2 type transport system ATP-binding protein
LIDAIGLRKSFHQVEALDGFDLSVAAGHVVGLIGPNGAGKTTALKAILGLTPLDGGQLRVLGHDPHRQRKAVMERTGYVADLGTLPRWMRVSQAMTFLTGVHPAFRRDLAEAALRGTGIHLHARIRTLSKGMAAELHLALMLALQVDLLVLDEPTLGLDIINRQRFYERLVNDWITPERAVLVTSHEVREIEHLLTDVVFIHRGRTLLAAPMSTITERFTKLEVDAANADAARRLAPLAERATPNGVSLVFDGTPRSSLEPLGAVATPSLPELFVALLDEGR